jgi:hypothetical protein
MGARFNKARWKAPYDGVVEQYREAVPQNSMHLKVRADGTWILDHIDNDNPDMGREVQHFINDHPVGQFIKGAATVAAVGFLAVGVASLFKDSLQSPRSAHRRRGNRSQG